MTATVAMSPPASLHGCLEAHAAAVPDALALRFLADGEGDGQTLDYATLARRAKLKATALLAAGATGEPVLLARPAGLEFIEDLFACWFAGAIAVPAHPPRGGRHRQRLAGLLADSGARLAFAAEEIAGVRRIDSAGGSPATGFPEIDPTRPCLLQYTSGSTAAPKGVQLHHSHFRSHFEATRAHGGWHSRSVVSWLPPWHDMGLVLKILHAIQAGVPLTFFAPEHFMQKPLRWLQAISRHRADLSGAPDFAYQLCLRTVRDADLAALDLSCWTTAACGAERVRAETLDRFARKFAPAGFRAEAFAPGYGLAETTLIVTAASGMRRGRDGLVSNGRPLPGAAVRIVCPETEIPCGEGAPGEIRVKGPAVTTGYWKRPAETAAAFDAAGWFRTGDLGFIENGELFVSGRLSDRIIVHGRNIAPEDVEAAVLAGISTVTATAAVAFESDGRETVVVLAEAGNVAPRERRELAGRIRRLAAEVLESPPDRVVLTRTGVLPRTTSGKIQRGACRELLANHRLKFLLDDVSQSASPHGGMEELLAVVTEVSGRAARAEDDWLTLGMASMEVTRLAVRLRERFGTSVSIADLFEAGSISELAERLAQQPPEARLPDAPVPGSGLGTHALTPSQERMWFLHQLDPTSAAYHVFGAVELTGPLVPARLEAAIQAVVSRNPILRSRHGHCDGRPEVWVDPAVPKLETGGPADEEEVLLEFARRPFDLAADVPVRAILVRRSGTRHLLALCVHHIVADGGSIRLLAEEIAAHYRDGGLPAPRPDRVDHFDHALSHRRWLEAGGADAQVRYWCERLASHPGSLPLATDFPRPAQVSARGGAVERTLPDELQAAVAALARRARATPFMVHLSLYLMLLWRHGGGDDLVVAIPVANRNHPGTSGLIGTLVNTLPFRLRLDPGETFSALLGRVRAAVLEMQVHQDAPFEKIVEAVQPDRTLAQAPLAQAMFDHQELPLPGQWTTDLACRPLATHRGAVQFDLSLLLTDFSSHQRLAVEFRTDLFRRDTAAALLDRYLDGLDRACREPDARVGSFSLLTAGDESRLAAWSQGPRRPAFPETTALEEIAARCARHPQRVAVSAGGRVLDYAALAARSDALASALAAHGVRRGDRLAVLLDRNADLPVALLAIWKAGAAYVPLDAANPPERLRQILADQQPLRVLAAPGRAAALPEGAEVLFLTPEMLETRDPAPAVPPAPGDAAYVIYTSGSTGNPKGVVVPHGALANFLRSMAEAPGFTEADSLLAVTTLSFDIAGLELFLPLVSGGSVVIVPGETARDATALLASLRESRATVMQATPATWRMLSDAGWRGSPDLKILCGGEALDADLAARLRPLGCQLWNLYGPTETTIWSTLGQIAVPGAEISIGKPIANTGIHLLAADGTPVPPGVPGELWISGAGLATGYWRRPELTAAAFVSGADGTRRYRTGDFARWRPDGTLECLGRSDGQMKIRGFRVELGEIEAALLSHPQVGMAKAALRGTGAERRLVAWIMPAAGEAPPAEAGLREFLTTRLPPYMLPAAIGMVTGFPLNPSGKIDVAHMADPAVPVAPAAVAMTPTEQRLAEIWGDLLGRPVAGPADDWFQTGGHSLLALRLFSRIHHEFRLDLPLSTLLTHPTLAALAAAIDRNLGTPPE